jgi:hypothetical protein
VAKDSIEALKWYRKAADQGYAKAQYNLGLCYANGDGVRRDEIEAYAYWNLAMNDENARQNLGRLKKTMFPDSISRGEKRTGELQDEMHARRAGKEALRRLPPPPIPRIRINDARWQGNRVIITYYETAYPGLLVDCRNRRPAGAAADEGLGRDESGGS